MSVSTAPELCMPTTLTSVTFSNTCLLLMLLELPGGQLGSSVDLGWAHSHVQGGLLLAGVTEATRATQLHSLCLTLPQASPGMCSR